MRLNLLPRAAVLVATAAALVASSVPADAAAAGYVDVVSVGPSGTVDGKCAYTATLPDVDDFNSIEVAFSGVARATAARPTVAVISTSIRCYLRYDASGDAGITLPGSVAAVVGRGSVYRLALNPQICVVASAAFSDGSVVPPATYCRSL